MEAFVTEWFSLILRWMHVIAGIAWIGHAFLFHGIEHGLRAPEVDGVDPDVDGELWMVHGGGFFRMQKTRVLPPRRTGELKWFKWEAAFTWISGVLLLIVVFYLGGGLLLVDPGVSDISVAGAISVGVGTLVGGWLLYDLMWASPLGKHTAVASTLTIALIGGAAVGLPHVLSGRAAFIHVGGLMGTIMAANVWMRILPGMRRMIAALEAGREPDLNDGAIGKQRSVHNGYMHFPLIFIMISNHYPGTYAHDQNWLILLLFIAVGVCLRQFHYDGWRTHIAFKGALLTSLGALIYLTAPQAEGKYVAPVVEGQKAIDPASVGAIGGQVRFAGAPPQRKELKLHGGCEKGQSGPVVDDSILVADGRLQNAFVSIRSGHESWIPPLPPSEAIEVDQSGCIYVPRVHGVRAGQPVTFINSDPLFHNVRSVSGAGPAANPTIALNMPVKDQRITKVFRRPEVMVQTRCDVHPWMRAYIGVVSHPWFAVTDASGAFTLAGVPPGDYTVEVWHEVFGTQSRKVSVAAGAQVELAFEFVAK